MSDYTELIAELRSFERAHRIQAHDGFRPDHVEMADRYERAADALEAAEAATVEARRIAEQYREAASFALLLPWESPSEGGN